MTSPITTHILDTTTGKPAADISVCLYYWQNEQWGLIDQQKTDSDGRIKNFKISSFEKGKYQLIFKVEDYLLKYTQTPFFFDIDIKFEVYDTAQHYHVPLLLNPFSYSTYRGS